MYDDGKIKRNVIDIQYNKDQPKLTIGGYDDSTVTDAKPLTWHKLERPDDWSLNMTEIKVGGNSWLLDGGRKVLINPYSAKTVLPTQAYENLEAYIAGKLPGCTASSCPCTKEQFVNLFDRRNYWERNRTYRVEFTFRWF